MHDILINCPQEISGESKIPDEEDSADLDVVIPNPTAGIRSTSKSQHNSRRVVPTRCEGENIVEAPTTIRTVEKVLKNGDLYSGGLSGGVPHGTGKYLWSDGCMYEGEWRLGNASGKGRFSWPSGATYEGDFKDGRMNGEGTFIGAVGDTYRGHWLWGRKHGYGEKRYANGDIYQGNWKANLQDGPGRYVWSDGNEYVGDWKNGVICGKGVLNWANGNKYEGFWENGVPKGNGLFTLANERSSSVWGKKKKKKESLVETMEEEMVQKLFSVDSASRNTKFPRICVWELDGEAGDITYDIVDNMEAASMHSRETSESEIDANTTGGVDTYSVRSPWWFDRGSGGGSGAMPRPVPKSPKWLDQGDVKKPGESVTASHKSYDLMLNLQLGIRYSVGKHASRKLRELAQSDFDPNEKFWTRFPPEGSKSTPPHLSVDFRWKDYCPKVFRHLRELFGVDPADYMLAICGNESLREFCSPGKSGSCFYLTQDEKFMIKTVKKSEIKVLIKMLPNYYKHVCEYKNTLMTKFFGVHCVKPVGGQKTRFIVMGNLFCSEYRIHKRFDLKGSSHGRTIDKPECEIDETTTLKDLDLKYVFRLGTAWYQEFILKIDKDCEFLEAEKIMDYSLLIGLHFRDDCLRDDMSLTLRRKDANWDDARMRGYRSLPNMDFITEGREPLISLGANTPAKAERVTGFEPDHLVRSGSNSPTPRTCSSGREVFDVILYFGIIDILQDYDISKKIEHAYKSLHADSTSISAVDPKLYSRRFKEFIHKIFLEEE